MHALPGIRGRLAAVVGDLQFRARVVDTVGVLWVNANLRVVERAHIHCAGVVPRLAAVCGAIDAVGLGARAHGELFGRHRIRLGERVHHIRIAGRQCEPDAALGAVRISATLDLGPGCAGVRGLPERAAGSAAVQRVGRAIALPARRVDNIGISRIDGDVHKTRAVTDELGHRPRVAAIDGLVQSAFLVGRPRRAQCRNVEDVLVPWIDSDATDVLRLLQPHHRPRVATVSGLVDAGARLNGVARIWLASARPDRIGIGGCDSQHTHRDDVLVVKDRAPGDAVVGALPDATARGGNIECLGRSGNSNHVGEPAHEVGGSYRAPFEAGHGRVIERLCGDASGAGDERECTVQKCGAESEHSHRGVGVCWS